MRLPPGPPPGRPPGLPPGPPPGLPPSLRGLPPRMGARMPRPLMASTVNPPNVVSAPPSLARQGEEAETVSVSFSFQFYKFGIRECVSV